MSKFWMQPWLHHSEEVSAVRSGEHWDIFSYCFNTQYLPSYETWHLQELRVAQEFFETIILWNFFPLTVPWCSYHSHHFHIIYLQYEFCDDLQDWNANWSSYHTSHTCKVSPLCELACDTEAVKTDWRLYYTHHICRASLQCGHSDEAEDLRPDWSASHTTHTYMVSLLCGPSDACRGSGST